MRFSAPSVKYSKFKMGSLLCGAVKSAHQLPQACWLVCLCTLLTR